MTEFTNAPPCLSDEALLAITEQHFGITGKIQPLASERDQNARLSTSHGDYVLKVANLAEDPALLSLQNAVLSHLETVDPSLGVPRVVAAKNGRHLVTDACPGQGMLVRLLTFLDGRLFSTVERSPPLLTSLGRFMGRLSSALQCFGHPAAHRPEFLWNLDNALTCKTYLEDISDDRFYRSVRCPVPPRSCRSQSWCAPRGGGEGWPAPGNGCLRRPRNASAAGDFS